MRTTLVWILMCSAPAWQGVAQARDGDRLEQARVTRPDGKRLLYRESHYVLGGTTAERWVLYRCPDGRAFARKHVQPGALPMAPSFALEDGRDGYREGVRGSGATRTAYAGTGGTPSSASLAVPKDGVIDAGFDAAVRAHWDALMRGDTVRMQFLIPSRQRFFPVRVQRVGETRWKDVPAERLRMQLDAWFGFAVPAVTLVYARDDKRLLEFAGTGNVRDARGGNPQVKITFSPTPGPASAEALAAIRTAPLEGRCTF